MKKENLLIAVKILIKNNAPSDVVSELTDIVKNSESNIVKLLDKENFIASQIWVKEDIIIHLEEEGCETTEENIEKVIRNLDMKIMEDCSDGNNLIVNAIKKANLHSSY